MNKPCDLGHLFFFHAARRDGRGSHSKTARRHCRFVARDGVLVARNVDELKHFLCARAVETFPAQISENEMVVGASANELEIVSNKSSSQGLAVRKGLNGILLEIFALRLVQRNSQSGDGVVVGPSLQPWKNSPVDLISMVNNLALCICSLSTSAR